MVQDFQGAHKSLCGSQPLRWLQQVHRPPTSSSNLSLGGMPFAASPSEFPGPSHVHHVPTWGKRTHLECRCEINLSSAQAGVNSNPNLKYMMMMMRVMVMVMMMMMMTMTMMMRMTMTMTMTMTMRMMMMMTTTTMTMMMMMMVMVTVTVMVMVMVMLMVMLTVTVMVVVMMMLMLMWRHASFFLRFDSGIPYVWQGWGWSWSATDEQDTGRSCLRWIRSSPLDALGRGPMGHGWAMDGPWMAQRGSWHRWGDLGLWTLYKPSRLRRTACSVYSSFLGDSVGYVPWMQQAMAVVKVFSIKFIACCECYELLAASSCSFCFLRFWNWGGQNFCERFCRWFGVLPSLARMLTAGLLSSSACFHIQTSCAGAGIILRVSWSHASAWGSGALPCPWLCSGESTDWRTGKALRTCGSMAISAKDMSLATGGGTSSSREQTLDLWTLWLTRPLPATVRPSCSCFPLSQVVCLQLPLGTSHLQTPKRRFWTF